MIVSAPYFTCVIVYDMHYINIHAYIRTCILRWSDQNCVHAASHSSYTYLDHIVNYLVHRLYHGYHSLSDKILEVIVSEITIL